MSLNGAVTDGPFGTIVKPFSCSVLNTGADFVLRFPSNLDVKLKATLLGACILIVNIVKNAFFFTFYFCNLRLFY